LKTQLRIVTPPFFALRPARFWGYFSVMSEDAIRFTPRAQQALALARKEADRFHHNYVGPEHLLLGLINLGQGVATSVLQKAGLDLETVRNAVEKQVGTGPAAKPTGNIPYTPHVKQILALAQQEAQALNHSYVGTEHLLLGLLREDEGVAARVLKDLNVDPARCGIEILRELDPNFSGDATPRLPAQPQTAQSKFPWRKLSQWMGIKTPAAKVKSTRNFSFRSPGSTTITSAPSTCCWA
jgi:ATP-dependent Clp protease ATP-binding subunit ClpC